MDTKVTDRVNSTPFPGAPFTYGSAGFNPKVYGGTAFARAGRLRTAPNLLWVAKEGDYSPAIRKLVRGFGKWMDLGNGVFLTTNLIRRPYIRNVDFAESSGNKRWFKGDVPIGVGTTLMTDLLTKDLVWDSDDFAVASMVPLGSTAISRTLPNRSHANLALSLAELRAEGLPSIAMQNLFKNQGRNPQGPASEYIGYNFGIAPLVRDLVDLLKAVTGSAALLREYDNLANKHVRRKYTFPYVKRADSYQGASTWYPSMPHPLYSQLSAIPSVQRVYSQNTWFSGAYIYYNTVGDSLSDRIRIWEREANRILGSRITIEVLYNATMWTWLFDWFVNIGDVMKNASHIGQDGLVLHYGYLMQETRVDAEVELPGVYLNAGHQLVGEKVSLVRKSRIKATPYGFGFTASDFSQKQWNILAALSKSGSPGTYR